MSPLALPLLLPPLGTTHTQRSPPLKPTQHWGHWCWSLGRAKSTPNDIDEAIPSASHSSPPSNALAFPLFTGGPPGTATASLPNPLKTHTRRQPAQAVNTDDRYDLRFQGRVNGSDQQFSLMSSGTRLRLLSEARVTGHGLPLPVADDDVDGVILALLSISLAIYIDLRNEGD